MLSTILIASGVAIELFAVVLASRRNTQLDLRFVVAGILVLCVGLSLKVLAAGGLN